MTNSGGQVAPARSSGQRGLGDPVPRRAAVCAAAAAASGPRSEAKVVLDEELRKARLGPLRPE